MPITGTILDYGKNVSEITIDPVQLAALNTAWTHNALLLGKICLVVGFIIGAVSMYFYMRNKYGEL